MFLFCLLSLVLIMPFEAEVQEAYAEQDTDTLRRLLDQASTRVDSFLVRYRLYPLTEDPAILEGLPTDLDDGSAREYALLSGLWSYRAGEASIFRVIQYGRRSTRLLDRAKSIDGRNPYVLLVEGQSLLFRPEFAGRDAEAAAHCFKQLRSQSARPSGISEIEADVWYWVALREAGEERAASSVHDQLRKRSLPSLYQQFLDDPPDV